MPAGTNATTAIVGDTLVTAASFPQSKGQQPLIIAYRLGASGTVPTTSTGTTTTGRRWRRRRGQRQAGVHDELRQLPHAQRGGDVGQRRPEPRSAEAGHGHRGAPGAKRRRGDARLRGPFERGADHGRRGVRGPERRPERRRRWRRRRPGGSRGATHVLRNVGEDDLDALFEQQREPEAVAMALFPAREREAFDAHWRRILADDRLTTRAIEVEVRSPATSGPGNRTAGSSSATGSAASSGAGPRDGCPLGARRRGDTRPLHAWVATSNVGSIRVLEKCGFVKVGSHTQYAKDLDLNVDELLYELR